MSFVYYGIKYPNRIIFENMKRSEAKQFYQFFTNSISCRIEYLRERSNVILNYSGQSLIDIWEWFLNHASYRENDKTVLNAMLKELYASKLPSIIIDEIMIENKYVLTEETMFMIVDISIYLGELCRSVDPRLFWSIKYSRRYVLGNRPVVHGFRPEDKPDFVFDQDIVWGVRNQAKKTFEDKASKYDIYNMYNNKLLKNMCH